VGEIPLLFLPFASTFSDAVEDPSEHSAPTRETDGELIFFTACIR
jgi:hypothetical protein